MTRSPHLDSPFKRLARQGLPKVLLAAAVMLAGAATLSTAQADDTVQAQAPWLDASARRTDEGRGPFKRLVIRNAMIIDGTGGPMVGPGTVVVQGERIVSVGPDVSPQAGDEVIDATGQYLLPGLIDTHVRLIDAGFDALTPDYALKLLLAHGITTIASMQDYSRIDWALRLQREAQAGRIVAPRIQVWADIEGPDVATTRARVRDAHARGVVAVGEGSVYGGSTDIARAVLDEARKLGMNASWHMNARDCAHFDALDAAEAGLRGLTHWYCLPEVLFEPDQVQALPEGYRHVDVRARFQASGRLWKQAAAPGSARWNQALDAFLAKDFTFEPTFSVYEANRDYGGVSRFSWNQDYLHPLLAQTFVPSTGGRFSHFYDWSSTDEAEWRHNFQLWMRFVNDYKNRGGRVVAGADTGYMWTIPGFGYVRNLEMLQEAGFTPLEVVHAATLAGAEHLRLADDTGSIEPGKRADLLLVARNPLANLKALYGTGYPGLQADGSVAQVGGVRYTIQSGRVYDAPALLADVARMVADARRADISPGAER